MSTFNFTKVLKYTAGMAGLYFLENETRNNIKNKVISDIDNASEFKIRCNNTYSSRYANRDIQTAYRGIKTIVNFACELNHYKQMLGSLGANLFDNYVTQNEYVDCTISKYITQNYISNKWVQYAAMIVPSAILSYVYGSEFKKVFIESCILKAISDDYEDKVDVEVQPEDLNVSTPELLHI